MTTNLRSKNLSFFSKIFPGKLLLATFAVLLFCAGSLCAGAKTILVLPGNFAGLTGAVMTPQFDPTITNYTATVPDSVTSVTLGLSTFDFFTSEAVAVNGKPVAASAYPNGVGISAVIPLAVGVNVVQFGFFLVDPSQPASPNYPYDYGYTLTIVRAAGPPFNSSLSSLAVSDFSGNNISLSPAFSSNIKNYTATVPNNGPNASSIFITPTVADSTARVTSPQVQSGTKVGVSLNAGPNPVPITVTARDGSTSVYNLNITYIKNPSTNSLLSNLVVSGFSGNITLSPVFSSNIKNYTTTVPNNAPYASSISIIPTVADPTAKITGGAGGFGLAFGPNLFPVTVVAQDGSTSVYNVNITLTPLTNASLTSLTLYDNNSATANNTLSPAFSPNVTNYTASAIAGYIASEHVVLGIDNTQTATVNGIAVQGQSADVPLSLGQNTLSIVVTAQDGATTKNYTVNLNRTAPAGASTNSRLTSLSISNGYNGANVSLSPNFSGNVTGYTGIVPAPATYINVALAAADPSAILSVNGQNYGVVHLVGGGFILMLAYGQNTENFTITAQDGTSTTYTVNITRQISNNADLTSLGISSIVFQQPFSPNTLNYTGSATTDVQSIYVFPGFDSQTQTVKVNGVAFMPDSVTVNGNKIFNYVYVTLPIGQTKLSITVLAQDGITSKTYTLTITRTAPTLPLSSNSQLSNLTLSLPYSAPALLSPGFSPTQTNYLVSVPESVTYVNVSSFASGYSTVYINNVLAYPGQPIPPVLPLGNNTIKVLAQDGVSSTTYNINVTHALSSDATLSTLLAYYVSNGIGVYATTSPAFDSNVTNYTASVPNNVDSLYVNGTANSTIDSIAYSPAVGPYGFTPLSLGINTIKVTVTAEDGLTTKTYTLAVTRAGTAGGTSDVTLKSLALSTGSLSPSFVNTDLDYLATVGNGVSSINVTPLTNDPLATVKVNGVATPYGAPSTAIPLSVGSNTISIVVVSSDGTATSTYTIYAVRAAPSSNANLVNLTLSNVNFSPSFASGTTSYTASVANNITSVMVTPTTSDATATVTVNGTTTPSGSASATIPLTVGANNITTAVTAQDGTTNTYTITVTRAPSSNANLVNLTLSNGTLSPAFAGGTMSYSASVANNITSVMVTPTTSDPLAMVTVNGVVTPSGSASAAIPLSVGANTIKTVVTAQDGTTINTYTVTVTRAASGNALLANLALGNGTLSPSFASGTFSYSALVANNVTLVTVTPTTVDPFATVTVNGVSTSFGLTSPSFNISVGVNTFSTVVTAQDGTTKTYTVTVTRAGSSNALLGNLSLTNGALGQLFASGTMSYNVSVANNITSISAYPVSADAHATITVNGVPTPSSSASAAIPLNVGANTITTVVTAQDGTTTDTYTIIVTRAPLGNSLLSNLTINYGTLSPSFSSGTMSYSVAVANNIQSVQVIPTTSDPAATVTVNGTGIQHGYGSQFIPLAVGANTVTTLVTASDGVTNSTYKIIVTRAAAGAGNANLIALRLSAGVINPSFVSATGSYTVLVPNSTTSLVVTPTANNPASSITVNGMAVVSGSQSTGIPLSLGANNISIAVTNTSGSKTYTVIVTRVPSDYAYLSGLKPGSGSLSPAFAFATLNYNVRVGRTIYTFTVTPTTLYPFETVKVNGLPVASGTASQAIPLADGLNNISVVVTAQNGTSTRTYTLLVTKESGSTYNVYQPTSVNSEAQNNLLAATNDIIVHQAVSPNGDGINDVLMIEGIASYPQNKLSIMDLNGKLVYEAEGYDNSSRVFDGHSNKTGTMQEPGTYYYLLEYTAGNEKKRSTGFFILKY